MASKKSRYKQFEKYITIVLIAALVLYVAYMFTAGFGVLWAKVILAILIFAISGVCLYLLWATKELFKPRSMWMTVGAVSLALCLLVSLLLNYPSPM